jgi:hypothetical protein
MTRTLTNEGGEHLYFRGMDIGLKESDPLVKKMTKEA